ncbi:MAG: hypothetical protein COB15_13570 [Flavobacteriales bacterium]|nr:MAG: hypothetical protein COB15_13570 [Flavobacteriales bacterium]
MKNTTFAVETKSGRFKSISFRTRWLISDQNSEHVPKGKAVGHAICRGRVACGHAECRGRVACGNPGNTRENINLTLKQLSNHYKDKLGEVPSKNASVFELIDAKSKLLSI